MGLSKVWDNKVFLVKAILLGLLYEMPQPGSLYAQSSSSGLTPLYKIKQDLDGDGIADLTGDTVIVSGIVNIATGQLHEIYLQTFIQNDSTGVSLFAESVDKPVKPGDSVVATGIIRQYYGLNEVHIEDYKIIKEGVSLPEPIALSKFMDRLHLFEGMIVNCSGRVAGKGSRFNGKYINISPAGISRSVMVYVSNFHTQYQDFDFESISIGDRVRATGILTQYNPEYPAKSTFKIVLRTPDDLDILGIPQSTLVWLGLFGIFISVLAIGWIVTLRAKVKSKTKQIRKSLSEKEILLKEIHHRVKNNLAIISGLIELQLDSTPNEETRKVLRDSQARIRSMAFVHDKLYRTSTVTDIAMKTYVEELVQVLKSTFASPDSDIKLEFDLDETNLDIDRAIPCGLLINELVVNAFKHAFDSHERGVLEIRLKQGGSDLELSVADNGPGLPDDIDIKKGSSLGMMLIDTFASQLKATMEVNNENGAQFSFSFPAEPVSGR